jgi:hypothetical protein
MKRFFAALALACLVSASGMAGEIPSLGAPQPPPPGTTGTTSAGDIPISGDPGQIPTDGATKQISDAALSALLAVFGLLG